MLPMGASAEQISALREELGLNKTIAEQFVIFVSNALQGDFGASFQYGRPAMSVVLEHLPATLQLAGAALLVGGILGAGIGILAAIYRGTLFETGLMTIALLGQAAPVFWVAVMLILVFAVNLGWLPTGGYGGIENLILPATALSVYVAASLARLARGSVLDVINAEYVRTAWAKGLSSRVVYVRHVVRGALIPIVTLFGIIAGELLGGSVVAETIFGWPGIGRVTIQAIEARDFAVVQASVMIIAAIFVGINFAIDLLYGVLDPRIRLTRKA
ncbi:Dipeptide transport system permease protein DppB [Salipiger mucosus DSM 16094]|uniref:Dipeptide transport system permease protein DppB n=2 Tax=Salipiger mucosus TaxID=263378 RepID=S9Q747_9RHOB|nr:Dipeptide transport system permease protein DppB [Salipiger mucosus DSM 16094]